jgi:hypothetical protein
VQPQILWRANSFRLTVPGTQVTVPFFLTRALVSILEIQADDANIGPCNVGSSQVTSSVTDPAGIGGNIYFQLDSGRHAYIWTDDPLLELIDVSQFSACTTVANVNQFLHITMWMGQRL